MFIKRALHQTMATRRNDRLDAVAVQMFEDGVGIVGLVGTEPVWMNALQQRDRFGAVAGLTAGKPKSGQAAQPVDQGVNLGAQSAAGSPERLVAVFLGAPAAC